MWNFQGIILIYFAINKHREILKSALVYIPFKISDNRGYIFIDKNENERKLNNVT